MSDRLHSLEALVSERYRTAMLFSVPLFVGLALLLLQGVWSVTLVPEGAVFASIVAGLVIAAVPVTRYHRARTALNREKTLANLAALAEVFEAPK